MGDIGIDDYKVPQLKKWLAALGLQTKGSNAELVARLNQVETRIRESEPVAQNFF